MAERQDMPIGLAFQMAMNQKAMEHFAQLSEEEKGQILDEARSASSKSQMRGIVDSLERME
ncbi:MAG: hypothetical protein J6B50_09170 [Lachnospiraceae bacterium]|nr:hypothetical protein [Lachnospiraceae bacterium]MBP3507399.1 hypothetical protein [Lachnospiraceae bacterium]